MGIQRDGKRLRGKRLVTLEETELKCVEAAGGGRGEDGGRTGGGPAQTLRFALQEVIQRPRESRELRGRGRGFSYYRWRGVCEQVEMHYRDKQMHAG